MNAFITVEMKTAWWFMPALRVLRMLVLLRLVRRSTARRLAVIVGQHSMRCRVGAGRWSKLTLPRDELEAAVVGGES